MRRGGREPASRGRKSTPGRIPRRNPRLPPTLRPRARLCRRRWNGYRARSITWRWGTSRTRADTSSTATERYPRIRFASRARGTSRIRISSDAAATRWSPRSSPRRRRFTITRATRRVSTTTRGSTRTRTRTGNCGIGNFARRCTCPPRGTASRTCSGRSRGTRRRRRRDARSDGGCDRNRCGRTRRSAGKDCERRQTSRGVTETSTRGRVWA